MLLAALAGCSRLGYYAHLGKGGLALATRGEKVEKLLCDPETPGELASRLRFARELLEFADARLGLPVEKKYRRYLDLKRPYVVWTVVATPEFSLEPKTWCFPIAGCVGYRGFFTPERAGRFADGLRAQGFDVSVGGVRAFSSLGWFGDPLLNTFVFEQDQQVAGLLFHELAHGLVYVKGDTAFNESFATAVERAAVRRWLEATASGGAKAVVVEYQRFLDQVDHAAAVVERIRERLRALYESPALEIRVASRDSPEAMVALPEIRRRKAELFAELQLDLAASDPEHRSALAGWIGRNLNNADLASAGFYRERLAFFEDLLGAVDGDLESFYSSARCLAELPTEDRNHRFETGTWGECILAGSGEME